MGVTHETEYDQSLHSMRLHLRTNFIPPIPEGFAQVAVDALDLLEMGGEPWDFIFCPDMTAMPDSGIEVPGGWKIPALTAVRIARLEYSLSEQAVEKINARYESDEIPEWWMEWDV